MNGDADRATASRAKSAARALMLLELLADHPRGLTFTEISDAMRIPKSSLHELLTILTERSFAELSPSSRRYSLGIRVWSCGQAYLGQRDLVAEARPIMESIAHAANETVQLATLDGLDTVYLERVDSAHPLRLQTRVGTRLPAHVTSLGKVLLADLRERELLRRLEGHPLARFTPNSIGSPTELLKELQRVRAVGFAVDNEEYSIGLRCVAVPIRDHTGEVVAGLSMAVPLMRGDVSNLVVDLMALSQAALDLSRHLGCPEVLAQKSLFDSAAALEPAMEAYLQRTTPMDLVPSASPR